MNQKGSRQNPYSTDEYVLISKESEWCGGWVVASSNNTKYYARQNHELIKATDGGILGSENRPFSYALFQEMRGSGTWTGGWVSPNPSNPDHRGTTYHTEGDAIYGEINFIPFGDEQNPVPIAIQTEMTLNEIWLGGWVIYENNHKEYIESMYYNSESGCGSGSGSGSNTGSGSGSGNSNGSGTGMVLPGFGYLNIVDEVYEKNYPITVSWGYGLAAPGGTSITATLDIENGPTPRAEWYELYTMLVSCGGKSIEYSVPEIFWE